MIKLKPPPKPRPPKLPPEDPDLVTQEALSIIVAFSVATLIRWRKTHPDYPQPQNGKWSVKAWREWFAKYPGLGLSNGNKATGTREELLCEQLAKKNTLLDREIAERDLSLVSVDRLLSVFQQERATVMAALRRRLLSEIPAEAEGKPAREIAALLDEALAEFLSDIQDSIPRIIHGAAESRSS